MILAMAGNIIPAIATTNAVIAGLIVMEAIKILKEEFEKCRGVYLLRAPNQSRHLLLPTTLQKSNPQCLVCSNEIGFVTLEVNTERMTVGHLIEKVLKGNFAMMDPMIQNGQAVIYESPLEGEEENMEHQRPKLLKDVGIVHNTILSVEDFNQDFRLNISIVHSTQKKMPPSTENGGKEEEEALLESDFVVVGSVNQLKKQTQEGSKEKEEKSKQEEEKKKGDGDEGGDDEEIEIVVPSSSNKRKVNESQQQEKREEKKRKVTTENNTSNLIITIDD